MLNLYKLKFCMGIYRYLIMFLKLIIDNIAAV